MTDKSQRGGRRSPPGGRPRTTASGERRIKISITIDKALIDWLDTQGDNRSNVIERLLQERKGQP